MKKFKHKQTGKIVEYRNRGYFVSDLPQSQPSQNIPKWVIENSIGDWEEVKEKEYEILSVTASDKNINNKNKEFVIPYYVCNKDLEMWNVHSVKRISDGEVFTIGEFADFGNRDVYKISSFGNYKDKENNFWAFFNNKKEYGANLSMIRKPKQPLFTTEDGKEIYKGDDYWYVVIGNPNYFIGHEWKALNHIADWDRGKKLTKPPIGGVQFSTRELAEEYVLMNKPCLSANDILNLMTTKLHVTGQHIEELAKSKINQSAK